MHRCHAESAHPGITIRACSAYSRTERAASLLLALLAQQPCQTASPGTFCRGLLVSPVQVPDKGEAEGL